MQKKLSIFALIVLFCFSGTAFATYKECPDGTTVPDNKPCPVTNPPEATTWWQQQQQQTNANSSSTGGNSQNTNTAAGGNLRNSGNSSSTSEGGNSSSNSTGGTSSSSVGSVSSSSNSSSGGNTMTGGSNTSNTSVGQSGNSAVSMDTSDRSTTSYVSRDLFLPTIQNAAPSIIAGSNMIVDRGSCGPRMRKTQSKVSGVYVGLITKSEIDLGVDDELVSSEEPYRYWTDPNGAQHVFGHQVVTYATVVGVAASRSLNLGGGEAAGNWAQGGASSNSSVQRTVIRVQLQECEMQTTPRTVPVLIEVPPKRKAG